MVENFSIDNWTKTQEEVWRTVLKYTNLIIEGKIDEFLKYLHEDYTGWNNVEPLPADKLSIINELKNKSKHNLKRKYILIPIKLNIHRDLAIVHYYLRKESDGDGNYSNFIIKHYTDVLINSNSRWLLIADHFGIQKINNKNDILEEF